MSHNEKAEAGSVKKPAPPESYAAHRLDGRVPTGRPQGHLAAPPHRAFTLTPPRLSVILPPPS